MERKKKTKKQTTQTAPIFKAKSLSASYGVALDKVVVFEDVSFELGAGEILAVFGPNGCGKSTIIKSLAGLLTNTSGEAQIGDTPLAESQIGYVPQDFRQSFFPWTTLYGNIALARSEFLRPSHGTRDRSDQIKEALGIEVDFGLHPDECSGGMLQQSAIARALATEPDIVLADEPFSALDFTVARNLRKNLKKELAKQSIPMIVVLHSVQDIVAIADHVLVIPTLSFSTTTSEIGRRAELIPNLRDQQVNTDPDIGFVEFARQMLLDHA